MSCWPNFWVDRACAPWHGPTASTKGDRRPDWQAALTNFGPFEPWRQHSCLAFAATGGSARIVRTGQRAGQGWRCPLPANRTGQGRQDTRGVGELADSMLVMPKPTRSRVFVLTSKGAAPGCRAAPGASRTVPAPGAKEGAPAVGVAQEGSRGRCRGLLSGRGPATIYRPPCRTHPRARLSHSVRRTPAYIARRGRRAIEAERRGCPGRRAVGWSTGDEVLRGEVLCGCCCAV
jgi:hypothetical protein